MTGPATAARVDDKSGEQIPEDEPSDNENDSESECDVVTKEKRRHSFFICLFVCLFCSAQGVVGFHALGGARTGAQ